MLFIITNNLNFFKEIAMETFYYDNRQLQKLVFLNAVMLCLVILAGNACPNCLWWISIVSVLCLVSFSASLYVVIFPQRLALVNDEGIKIDHNATLKWTDIAKAEQKRASGFLKREIITIIPKEGVAYRRTLMQHLSGRSPYGEFSVPLYAMTGEDAKAIIKAMEKHIKVTKPE